jgi:hypothetical protein
MPDLKKSTQAYAFFAVVDRHNHAGLGFWPFPVATGTRQATAWGARLHSRWPIRLVPGPDPDPTGRPRTGRRGEAHGRAEQPGRAGQQPARAESLAAALCRQGEVHLHRPAVQLRQRRLGLQGQQPADLQVAGRGGRHGRRNARPAVVVSRSVV